MKNKFTSTLASALALSVLLGGASCTSAPTTTTLIPEVGKMVTIPPGVQYTILALGAGERALPGHQITVNYTGKLTNGTVFDSSVGRPPFTFILNAGQVIQGWDFGVAGMQVGEKRQLIIPPELGYGGAATGKIPANSVLIFEVELLGVK